MVIINFLLLIVLGISLLIVLYMGYLNYKQRQLNMQVAQELDVIIKSVTKHVKKTKETIKSLSAEDPFDLTSPEMLASLITIIVNKYGAITLSPKDFTNFKEGDFVSVYVDTHTQQLTLSLDANLETAEFVTMVSFGKVDTGTFH